MTDDPPDAVPGKTEGPSRIVTNSTWLLSSRLVVASIQWLTTLLIIRNLSVDDFGTFSLIFGILGMLSIITDLGLGRVAVKLLLDKGGDPARSAGAYITLRSVFGVLGYLVALGVVAVGGYGPVTVAATAIGALSVILDTVGDAHTTIFQVRERMRMPSVSAVLAASTQMLAVLALVQRDASLIPFMIPAVLASAVDCSIRVIGAHRLQNIRYAVDPRLWWHLLKEAVPISVGNAMATLYYRVDIVMLSQLATLTAVATYSVAYKFVDLVGVIPAVFSTAALPVLVRHWPADREGLQRVVLQICRLLAALAGLIAVGFLVLADEVVPLLYGQQYSDAVAPARIVVLSQCLSFAAEAALMVLIAAGRHKTFPVVAAVGLAFNIAVNLVVIPRYSYMGAAWATLATDVLMTIALWNEVRRNRLFPLIRLLALWRVAGCTLLTGLVGWAAVAWLWWPLVVVLMTVVFAGACLATSALGSRSPREALHIG
ncbi:MAG: flippase [Candidatus Nanopelagicales bacterium]